MTTDITEIEQNKKIEPQEDLNEFQLKNEEQLKKEQQLKEYLNTFYGSIYSTRMIIQLHLEIADVVKTGQLQHTQFWGCMQSSVYVSTVVSNMFAIFDDNNKHAFKGFIRFLRTMNIYSITDEHITRWLKTLEPYTGYRNCQIAHISLSKPFIPPVDYAPFRDVLTEFEQKLAEIHHQHITHHTLRNGTWYSSTVNLESELLIDIRNVLALSSASK